MSHDWFMPKRRIALVFGMSRFDAVWEISKQGDLKQAFRDLETTVRDCYQLLEGLKKYSIKKRDVINLGHNPTGADVTDALAKISKRLREGKKKRPVEKFLLVCLFAGHGILKDGMQSMLLNEYDENTGFYRLLCAEAKLRLWSEIYPNAYILGIFACCRQIFD